VGISVLGPLTIDDSAARLSPRETVILAALVASNGEALSADQLADVVWRDSPPASWQKNLQSCVVRLRKVLGPEAIETSGQGYRLRLPPDAVDARRFETLALRRRELLALDEPERAAYTLNQALALWRGRPLAELEEWEPGSIEAARLVELRLDTQEWWLEAALRAGHHREVVGQARALATAAPLRERLWALLALAEYRSGRQSDALATLRHVHRRLVDELGLDPSPEIGELEAAILRQDPALDVETVRARESEVCPYPGLTSYDVQDDEAFFGRDRDTEACLDRLDREGMLAVVGPSGSGKSSLVRAGVVARLRRGGEHCDRPGRRD
jgi:DNA-binding SARP family transcriptional activator